MTGLYSQLQCNVVLLKFDIMKTLRSESWKEFKVLVDFDNQPSGFRVFKVSIFDEDGNRVGTEYADNDNEKEDMTAVSDGYFFQCEWLTKK